MVTLLGMAPTAPSYQETIHPPTGGKFLQQPRGSEAGTWGGDREGWRPPWAGNNSWDMCPDTPSCPIDMCNKAIDLLRGSFRSLGMIWPPQRARLFLALLSTGAATSLRSGEPGAGTSSCFPSGTAGWLTACPVRPSAFQSGIAFIISLATSRNQFHAFQVQKPRPI